jgi:type II secretory pathway pseudopilin PulG
MNRAFTSIIKEKKVNPIAKQSNNKRAFTIVELLTVMSIIIILMGLLAPAMNRVRRYAWRVNQKNQFHSINVALELFRAEFEGYPDSGALDGSNPAGGVPYCGAMKLAEAMLGQDLLGFHPNSRFRSDGTIDGTVATQLYPDPAPAPPLPPLYVENLKTRKEHYLPLEQSNAYRLKYLFANAEPPFESDRFVLCDVYNRVVNTETGKRVGMPILYYKANTSNTRHNLIQPLDPQNIYYFGHNHQFVGLGVPWESGREHPLFQDPKKFYEMTVNDQIDLDGDGVGDRPCRADSYILLSAGHDGLYGTDDDVFNF